MKSSIAALALVIHLQGSGFAQVRQETRQLNASKFQSIKNARIALSTRYSLDILGRIQVANSCEHYSLDVPPIVSLLANQKYCRELGLSRKQASLLHKRIGRLRTLFKSQDEESFGNAVDLIEEAIRSMLSEQQLDACRESITATNFYQLGPQEFCTQAEVSQELIRRMRSRYPELIEQLDDKLRELETEILLEVLRDVRKGPVNELVRYIKTPGGFWQPNVSVLWQGLDDLDSSASRKAGSKPKYQNFVLSDSGQLQPMGTHHRDPFSEISTLLSAQKWTLNDEKSVQLYFTLLFENRLEKQKELAAKRAELEELHRESRGQLKEAWESALKQYQKEIEEFADTYLEELNEDERRTYAHARFLSDLRRLGMADCLHGKVTSASYYDFNQQEIAAISERAVAAKDRLRKRTVEIQAEIIEMMISDFPEESKAPFRFSDRGYVVGVPPLELLLYHLRSDK